jgi:hypothetical protein
MSPFTGNVLAAVIGVTVYTDAAANARSQDDAE